MKKFGGGTVRAAEALSFVRCLTALVLSVAAAITAVAVLPASSRAATLAATPYMGWNPYYANLGSANEVTFESVASSLIGAGLQQAGYRIFWLDFGWANGTRDSNGNLIISSTKWPDGMLGFTNWLHQHGFLAGIYTDAGTSGCKNRQGVYQGVGSYGHYAAGSTNPYSRDANQFAAWGFDAVKVDFCGAGEEWSDQPPRDPRTLYGLFSQALASTGRPMILNVCDFWTPGKIDGTNPSYDDSSWGTYKWASPIAQSWRTDTDIGATRSILFQNVLRNLDEDAAHPEAAGPGHWNDPDYLGPGLGMTGTEAKSQLSMWAMLSAPLILGSDPRNLSSSEIGMLENRGVIQIDQDSFGAQGTLAEESGSNQVWIKPLSNGDTAVALLNRGDSASQITTSASQLGLAPAGSYTLDDVWANASTTTTDQISANVPSHGVFLYRVTPGSGTDPTVTTQAPSSISATDATLSGTVYPNASDTLYEFQYGVSGPPYDHTTAPADAGSGTAAVAASDSLSGLIPGTVYHYRLCAGRSDGSGGLTVLACGEDQQFVIPDPPTAVTAPASGISATGAVLNGTVDPNGTATTYRFEYSTDPLLQRDVFYSPGTDASAGSGSSPQSVSRTVVGLQPSTTYYFRLVATDRGSPFEGPTDSFQTLPPPPGATTGNATGVSTTGATLNGSVNPNGTATMYHFAYSTDPRMQSGVIDAPAPDATAGSASATQPESQGVSGLRPGTTYYFRIVASNPSGLTSAPIQAFTTLAPPVLSRLSIKPSRLRSVAVGARVSHAGRKRPARPRAARITYTDSATARTKFTILETIIGVRRGKRCVRTSQRRGKRGRGCFMTVAVASFTRVDVAGRNSFRFTGRVRGRWLAPGRYMIKLVARDSGGYSSPLTASFQIVR